jgi:hypothetical protein
MSEFSIGIQQRIRDTEAALRRAAEAGDDFMVEVEQADLDDLIRLAAEHGVSVLRQSA